MNEKSKGRLQKSLFASTSAFMDPIDQPYPVELVYPVQPVVAQTTPDFKKVAAQLVATLEDALFAVEDENRIEVVDRLEEALALARQHA